MTSYIEINGRRIGPGEPTYIVAEMSANHNQSLDEAIRLVEAAHAAGVDAVKLQTYTADTLTIDCDNRYFQIGAGTIWEGSNLHDLYGQAYTPWEWQPRLKEVADDLGMDLFSSPFDASAVDFLEEMNVPAYKVASFEIVDLPLIRRMAKTGKPMIMSTGMATLAEIDEAVHAARGAGCEQLMLLKCTSAYPAPPSEMHLRTIAHMAETFGVPVGLSDHTLGIAVPIAAIAAGACAIEKHYTMSRSIPGPDSSFSLEPAELKAMVEAVRTVEGAMGTIHYGANERESNSRIFRRSLFVVEDMEASEAFTERNVRSIRPGHGLHTRYFDQVLGRQAATPIKRGTPLSWRLIQ